MSESRVDCSRVMVLVGKGTLTRSLKVSGWKMKESSIGRRMELVRWNMPQDEIRKIGTGLVVQ